MSDVIIPKKFFRSEDSKNFRKVVDYIRGFDPNFLNPKTYSYTKFDIDKVVYNNSGVKIDNGYCFHHSGYNNYIEVHIMYSANNNARFYGNFPGYLIISYEKAKQGLVPHNVHRTFMDSDSGSFNTFGVYYKACKSDGIDVENFTDEDLAFIEMKWG